MECGERWEEIAQGDPLDLWTFVGGHSADVQTAKETIRNRQASLPPVDEPHPIRERLEEPVEYRATALHMMREIGARQSLSMRITALNFLHELTDYRIEERRWKQETAMMELISSLRREAEDV